MFSDADDSVCFRVDVMKAFDKLGHFCLFTRELLFKYYLGFIKLAFENMLRSLHKFSPALCDLNCMSLWQFSLVSQKVKNLRHR